MDPQRVLESLAREKGVPLTSLGEVSSRYSKSGKVACCGGLMTRLVTESAADSTVLLRDGSGSCYCALHGDITNRYPDVLTTGALLLFTDVTVLVLSSKVPPLLIACLQNLSGLLLPDEASAAAAVAGMDTADSVLMPDAAAPLDSATTTDTPFFHPDAVANESVDGRAILPGNSVMEGEIYANQQQPLLGELSNERHASAAMGSGVSSTSLVNSMRSTFTGNEPHALPAPKKARVEGSVAASTTGHNDNNDDDDDAECLELVDDW